MSYFLLDENLSRRLIDRLATVFNRITHVGTEGLLNSTDNNIWEFARNANALIITKDYDFSDMSHLYGCPPKVIKLNCGNRTTQFIGDLLIAQAQLIHSFAESDKCYLEIF